MRKEENKDCLCYKGGMSSADRDIAVQVRVGSANVRKYTQICRTLCSYRGMMQKNVINRNHLT
jgi:hypothetical protein